MTDARKDEALEDVYEGPQLYLITPVAFETAAYVATLAACLDAAPVGCVRLALALRDEDVIARAADALREVCHARDVALVIDSHARLAARLGLDGVHLTDGARSLRAVRKELGDDAIVGTFCGASRHEGLTAGEIGADYVSFGPVGASLLGTAAPAPLELFEWWSGVVEVPVVAEGGLDEDLVRALAPHADFLAFGDELWSSDDPAATLRRLHAATL